MKKVVISGATSMLGLALIDKCIEKNIEVLALVNPGSPRKNRIPVNNLVCVLECDMDHMDEKTLSNTSITRDYEVFYHLAWAATSHKGRQDVRAHLQNVSYTIDAVEFASVLGCSKFVGTGSQAEYGRHDVPLNGDTPTRPEVPYGSAKLCAGQMSRIRCEQLGMEHVWTRVLSAYGPYDNENTIIPILVKALLKKEHFPTTEGKQMWELIYSSDVAAALYLVGEKGINGKIYPIGTGDAKPLSVFLETVKNQIDPTVQLGYGEIPYGSKQIMHLEADIEELKRDTGFCPRISFEEGIKETIKYFQDRV